MHSLQVLLESTPENKLNETLKHHFFADELIDITAQEEQALVILVNLTRPATEKAYLLDKDAAEARLADDEWRKEVLITAPWLASHYIKDPDSRAHGCIRSFTEDELARRGVKLFGWSHNANKVSRSHFLFTEFVHEGLVTSLVEQFSNSVIALPKVIEILLDSGFPEDALEDFQNTCTNALRQCFPAFLSDYSKRLVFPDGQGSYMEITPVVSAYAQRRIHNLIKLPGVACRPVFYPKPFLVSSFLATCGGRLYCLYYPPKLGRKDFSLQEVLSLKKRHGHLLKAEALLNKKALYIFHEIVRGPFQQESDQQYKKKRKILNERLQKILEELFSHLYFLRGKYPVFRQEIEAVLGASWEVEFVALKGPMSPDVVKYFLSQINQIFEKSHCALALAYEPLLIEVLQRSLKRFLMKPVAKATHKGNTFLHLERLLVYDANARGAPYLLGMPSLTAWAGMVHAFLCTLGFSRSELGFRFAVILRKFAMNTGHILPEHILKAGKLLNGPIVDRRTCDIEFDLVIQLSTTDEALDFSSRKIYQCLPRRLAGGLLSSPLEGSYRNAHFYKKCSCLGSIDELAWSLADLPSFARVITAYSTSGLSIEEIISSLSNDSQLLPLGSGYKFLCPPTTREGAEYFHTFADSALSLAKLRRVSVDAMLQSGFWSLTPSQQGIDIHVVRDSE